MSSAIPTKTFYIPERKGDNGKVTRSQLYINVVYKATCINVIQLSLVEELLGVEYMRKLNKRNNITI